MARGKNAAEGNTVTPQRARVRLPDAPLTPDERATAQAAFLRAFAISANVSRSAKAAHVSRKTVYKWLKDDEAFQTAYDAADADAQDVLRQETFRRAVVGVPEPLTNAQGLIYEYEPVLGEDGQPQYDGKGKPLMKRGKIVTVKKYSDGLLQAMLKARVPEYRDKTRLEVTGKDGDPIAYEHTFPDNPDAAAAARALLRLVGGVGGGGSAPDTSGPRPSGE